MPGPAVTAVIPTTLDPRRLPFIRAAIDSALAQEGVDGCEVLLVHNGSPPERRELVAEYLPRVRYVYAEVANIGDARNRGVAEARGHYVAFLDDDDLWLPGKVRAQAGALDANPDVDVVFTDTELFTEEGVVHASYMRHVGGLDALPRERRADGTWVQTGDWFGYLIRNCPFLPSCWMGRTEVLRAMPFVRTLSEDRELLWRLSRRRHLAFVDEVLVRKRDHASNISQDLESCFVGMVEGARRAAAWPLDPADRAAMRVWEADALFQLGYLARRRGRHGEAFRHQVASFRLAPRVLPLKEGVKNMLRLRGRAGTA